MHFLADYGLFLLKMMTAFVTIVVLVVCVLVIARKSKGAHKNKLYIKNINEKYKGFAAALNAEILSKKAHKKLLKEKKAHKKEEAATEKTGKRIFVLQFDGDIRASAVAPLREEITAILSVATPADEVVVCLESGGGMVPSYGLAASQLQRLKNKRIPLTITIDKIAASGGYMMACVADRILAAPFAIIGSVGVVAQLPNFHRYLKNKDIDFELITAGEYKRTLTLFGEVTRKGRQKMQADLEEILVSFKNFIHQNRPQVIVDEIATGEHWLASRALELKLVDELTTSDDYLYAASQRADIYQVNYCIKKSLAEKLTSAVYSTYTSLFNPSSF